MFSDLRDPQKAIFKDTFVFFSFFSAVYIIISA